MAPETPTRELSTTRTRSGFENGVLMSVACGEVEETEQRLRRCRGRRGVRQREEERRRLRRKDARRQTFTAYTLEIPLAAALTCANPPPAVTALARREDRGSARPAPVGPKRSP